MNINLFALQFFESSSDKIKNFKLKQQFSEQLRLIELKIF